MTCHLCIASCELPDLLAVRIFNFYGVISINDAANGKINGGLVLQGSSFFGGPQRETEESLRLSGLFPINNGKLHSQWRAIWLYEEIKQLSWHLSYLISTFTDLI